MKTKVAVISIISILLFVMIQFSSLELTSQVNDHINKGDKFFEADKLEEASGEFLDGLVLTSLKENSLKDKGSLLNNNLGMLSYAKQEYQEANDYFDKGFGNYLLRGNAYYYLGDLEEDPALKLELYRKALDMYKEGIIDNPQDLDLKFNYEYVADKLKQEEQDQQDQEQEDQDSQDGEQSEESQDSQDGEQSEESQDSQDGQQSEDSQDSQDGQQSEDSQDSQDGQQSEDAQDSQDGQQSGEYQGAEDSQQGQPLQGEMSPEEYDELVRILELLEQQEEDSLKNNQEVIQEGNGNVNDW